MMRQIEEFENTILINKRKAVLGRNNTFIKVMLCCILIIVVRGDSLASKNPDSVLHKLGYSIIPTPQCADLTSNNIFIDDSWQLISEVGNDISVTEIAQYVEKFHGLKFKGNSSKKIILIIEPEIV